MFRDSKKIVLKKTLRFGLGVFAKKTIRKNEIVAVFDGPIYDGDYEPWTHDLYNHTIQFGKNLWRDSMGLARYVNHSCDPNCGIKKLFYVVAMRTIRPGEQITWDYEMTEKNPTWRLKCKCGSPLCRKIIGHYRMMPLEIRIKYKGYISEWIIKSEKVSRSLRMKKRK